MTIPVYNTGTVSVTAGGTSVFNAGTAIWSNGNAKEGDWIVIAGLMTMVLAVADTEHLTIPPWQGASQSSVPYTIYQNYSARDDSTAIAKDVGTLVAALNKEGFIWFVGPDETAPDPSRGDDGQFAYQPATGKQWHKEGGAWVYDGIFKGLGTPAPYDNGKTYSLNDVAASGGSSYVFINATPSAGHAPPNATYWAVLAGKGDTGSAATIAVGSVTTGAPGSSADVVNAGTSGAAVFNFTIPRGAPGAGDMSSVNYGSEYAGNLPLLRSNLKADSVLYALWFGVSSIASEAANTAGFAAAIAALPASGGMIILPAGILLGKVNVNKPGVILQGQGMGYVGAPTGAAATEIRSSGAADNVIEFNANSGSLRDVLVTSSVAAGSRTGAGVKIGSVQAIEIRNVVSNGHKYGFWNRAPGNTFVQCYGSFNNLYGCFLDGTSFDQSEIQLTCCQFNSNAHGLGFAGNGIGIFSYRTTLANNTGNGMYFEPGSTILDIYMLQPEISTNGVHGVDAIYNTGAHLEFSAGGVIEVLGGAGNAIRTGVNQDGLMVDGTTITGGADHVVIDVSGEDTQITNSKIVSNGTNTFAININATAVGALISDNMMKGAGIGQTACLINIGATHVRFVDNLCRGYATTVNNLSTSGTNIIQDNSGVQTQSRQTGRTGNITTDATYGPLYYATAVVTFPKPFSKAPKVFLTATDGGGGGAFTGYASGVTTTGFTALAIGITNGGAFALDWLAIQEDHT